MPRLALTAIFSFLALGLVTNPARSQELLRWKLKPGETFQVSVSQQTNSQVAFSGKQTATKIDLSIDLTWKVASVDDGGIHLRQSLQRVQLKLNSPKAGTVEYDSAAQAKLTGPARDVVAILQPLLGAEIELTMNDRGEVQGTKPIGEAADKLFAADSAGQPGVFSKRAISQLLKQPLAVLPEKSVSKGDTWTTTTELAAAAGNFNQETKYTLEGEVDQGGQKLAKITSSSVLTPVPAAPSAQGKLKLKSHEQSGIILFSAEAGRLVEAEQSQKMTTERPYRELTIVVTLSSTQKTTIEPADK